MNIQKSKLNIGKARRRVQIRSALLLTLGVCFVMSMLRGLWGTNLPAAIGVRIVYVLEMLLSLACFGGGAYLGLCVLDGDHRKLVPMRKLSRAQILWLSLLGVLAVAPVSLADDLMQKLLGTAYATVFYAPSAPDDFLQTVVKSVLLAPICEELFFRGYLLAALAPHGKLRAAAVVSLCFALVHPLDGLVPLALFGALLCWMTLRTQSILSPVLVHMSYNMTLILIDSIGVPGLFMGWSFFSCALRLALCAAFMAVLKRAHGARRAGGTFTLWEGGKLSRREKALFAAAVLLFVVTVIAGG